MTARVPRLTCVRASTAVANLGIADVRSCPKDAPKCRFCPCDARFETVNRNALRPVKILRACFSNGASRSAICR